MTDQQFKTLKILAITNIVVAALTPLAIFFFYMAITRSWYVDNNFLTP